MSSGLDLKQKNFHGRPDPIKPDKSLLQGRKYSKSNFQANKARWYSKKHLNYSRELS